MNTITTFIIFKNIFSKIMLKRVMFEKLVHLERNQKWTSVKRQHFLHVRAAYHVFCTKHQGSLSVVCWSLNRYHWPKVAVTTDVFGSVQCFENPTTNFSYYTNLNILLLQLFAEEARIFSKLLLLPVGHQVLRSSDREDFTHDISP